MDQFYKNENVKNCILIEDDYTTNFHPNSTDYWWGGASTFVINGGVNDNRNSILYNFEPNGQFILF